MIALLRWLTRSDYQVGSLHLTPQQMAEAEHWTLAQADPRLAVVTAGVDEMRRRAFWEVVDRKRAQPTKLRIVRNDVA
jgi:hypothetical protein